MNFLKRYYDKVILLTLFVFFALFTVLRGQKKLRRGYDDLAKKFDELRGK